MTRAELVSLLKATCGFCGHPWVSHACAAGAVGAEPSRSCNAHGCACIAQWLVEQEKFVVVATVEAPCCGISTLVVNVKPEHQSGAEWRSRCRQCERPITIRRVLEIVPDVGSHG